MDPAILNALNNQANHELYSAQCYQAMAYWCSDKEYNGYAEFFLQQADEERLHASKFFQHLLDRDICPKVTGLDAPRTEFANLREIADHAQKLERHNSENIRQCYSLAQDVKDFDCLPMLLEFIAEQVEEEAWTSKMVTLTRRAECAGSLYSLDRHITREMRDGNDE